MKTLEEIFYAEFQQMMYKRRAITGNFGLYDIEVPVFSEGISTRDIVYINGITEQYYDILNGSEAMLWSHGKLSRREFDSKGEFIKDKNGNYKVKEVVLPRDCVAVLSKWQIGVPTKFKSKEEFDYVDYVQRKKPNGEIEVRYVYIIPREYCYKMNQTALVISYTKLRSYYSGMSVALTNGYYLYLYVVPYKPTSNRAHGYRVLCTKTSIDYKDEIDACSKFWNEKGMLFPYDYCQLTEGVKGKSNVAYETLPDIASEFLRYNQERSMAKVGDTADMWGEGDYSDESI